MADDILKYKVGDRYKVGIGASANVGNIVTVSSVSGPHVYFTHCKGCYTLPYLNNHYVYVPDIKPLYKIY